MQQTRKEEEEKSPIKRLETDIKKQTAPSAINMNLKQILKQQEFTRQIEILIDRENNDVIDRLTKIQDEFPRVNFVQPFYAQHAIAKEFEREMASCILDFK